MAGRRVESITPDGRCYVDGEHYQVVVSPQGALGIQKLDEQGPGVDQATAPTPPSKSELERLGLSIDQS